jgi:hypothetical protein
MALEPGPQVFDWIQIGRIGRKKGNLDVSVEAVKKPSDVRESGHRQMELMR